MTEKEAMDRIKSLLFQGCRRYWMSYNEIYELLIENGYAHKIHDILNQVEQEED